MSRTKARAAADHGVWPYLLPEVSFLVTLQVFARVPDDALGGAELFLKPAIPAALLVYFATRGAYPELRRARLDLERRMLDVLLGLALAALWMAPYLLFDALRPDVEGFDPDRLGEANRMLVLGVRLAGFMLVTPVFEELFIRSFVMRYAEVWEDRGDFRKVPLARFGVRSFVATIVVFTATHQVWEWWVAVPWVALTNLWFYYRKDLWAVIVLHGTTNAAILVAAVLLGDVFTDGQGRPIPLWFFV